MRSRGEGGRKDAGGAGEGQRCPQHGDRRRPLLISLVMRAGKHRGKKESTAGCAGENKSGAGEMRCRGAPSNLSARCSDAGFSVSAGYQTDRVWSADADATRRSGSGAQRKMYLGGGNEGAELGAQVRAQRTLRH